MSARVEITERLGALRAVALDATPGPWTISSDGNGNVSGVMPEPEVLHDGEIFFAHNRERENFEADAEFIAALDPPTVIGLLDALDEVIAALHPEEGSKSVGHASLISVGKARHALAIHGIAFMDGLPPDPEEVTP